MNERTKRVVEKMETRDLPALLVTDQVNRRYLTGFTGSAGAALVTPAGAHLVVDGRYTEQAADQAEGYCIVPAGQDLNRAVGELLARLELDRVGFEAESVTYEIYHRLDTEMEGIEWVPTTGLVGELRMVKDSGEIERISEAASIADKAFEEILFSITPGRTEKEVALDFEFCMRRGGAERLAFPLIAVSGARSALPHGSPTDKEIADGDFVTFDYGVRLAGYCSDATRTVIVGKATDEQRKVYDAVRRAQEAAVEAVAPGITGRELDSIAREIIEEAGYGEYFGHGLGHGVGMAVHEGPSLSQRRGDTTLEPGMVVTVEPGIYIPRWGGVRIEDLAVVTDSGCEILTSIGKSLVVLGV